MTHTSGISVPLNIIRYVLGLLLISTCALQAGVRSAEESSDPEILNMYSVRSRIGDGKMMLRTFAEPVYYQDGSGIWRNISNKIHPSDSHDAAKYPFENSLNFFSTQYPAGAGKQGILTRVHNVEIQEWMEPGYAYLVNGKMESIHTFSGGTPELNAHQLVYHQVASGISVEFLQYNTRRKMNVHLASRSALGEIPADASHFISFEKWKLPEGYRILPSGSGLKVLNTSGKQIAFIESPDIYEKETASADAGITGSWKIEQKGNEWMIGLLCPVSWLQDPARKYPVVIDPSINFTPPMVSQATGHLTSATGTPVIGDLRMSGSTSYAFAKFDIHTLPYNAEITSVNFWGYHYSGNNSTNKIVRINDMESLDPSLATGPQISAQIDLNKSYTTTYVFAQTTALFGWKSAALSGTIISDLNYRAVTRGWTAIGMNHASGSTSAALQYGYDDPNPPYLEIIYTQNNYTHDAALIEVNPLSSDKPCAGSHPVYALIRNTGTSNLNSLALNWTINSVSQPVYNWSGTLTPGDTVRVQIGTYTFVKGVSHTLQVTTSSPNGQADPTSANNTLTNTVNVPLSGNYTLGSGGDYTSFALAGTALTTYGICGNVTFHILNGTYTESLSLPQIFGTGPNARITFQSQAGDSTAVVMESSTIPVLAVNGADYLSFRKMTIRTTSGTSTARVIEINNGSTQVRIENNILTGNITTGTATTRSVIYSAANTVMDSSISILNNVIRNGAYGIYWDGLNTSPYESGMRIEGNDIANAYVRGVFLQNLDAPVFRNNTIDHLSSSNNGYALSLTNCYNASEVSANSIRSKQHGILLTSLTGTSLLPAKLYNNQISCTPLTSIASYGIQMSTCTYLNIYHNSLNISNSFVPAVVSNAINEAGGSYIIYRNNIFRQSGGSGNTDHLIFTTGAGTGNSWDYNNYVWNSGSTEIASINGTVYTVSNSITFVGSGVGGTHSISVEPGFVSQHSMSHSNLLLNAGINLLSDVSTDISGFSRSMPVTMGAHEYKPGADDAGITAITPVLPCPGVNTVYAVITNFGAVAVDSARIEWTVNNIAQPAFQWSGNIGIASSGGPIAIGTYNFIAGNSYTIRAYTNLPNGNTDSAPANDTSSISISTALGGTYTLGSGGDYTSFTAARNALVNYGVCGNVTFNVMNGTYTEFFALPEIAGAGSNAVITFQSQSGDSSLVSLQSTNSPVVNLSGADYIRFRKIGIQNTGTSTTGARVIDFNSTSTHNTLENCRLTGNNNAGTGPARAVVYSDSPLTNDSVNFVLNNSIQGGSYGIYWEGYSSGTLESGIVISGNSISGAYVRPVYLENLNSPWLVKNVINHQSTANTGVYAISFINCTNSGLVEANSIVSKQHGILFSNVTGTVSQKFRVYNNSVSCLPSVSLITYGLHCTASSHMDIYHTSVNMVNPFTDSYSVYMDASGNLNFRNNIFRSASAGQSSDFLVFTSGGGSGNIFDYNNYAWTSGAPNIASIQGTVYTVSNSINYFVNGLGGVNSLNTEPGFVSTVNLRHSSILMNYGEDLTAYVSHDMDDSLRTIPPTMGAFEYKPGLDDAGILSIMPLKPCPGVNQVNVTFRNYGLVTLDSVKIQWSVNGISQPEYQWSGAIAPGQNSTSLSIGTYNFLANNTYTLRAWTLLPNGNADVLYSNDTSSIQSITALGGSYTLGAGGDFTTFTAARNALATYGVCGPVIFNVLNGTYTESLSIPEISGAGTQARIIFQSQSGDSTQVILQNSSAPVLNMAGVDYMGFRKMTIQTTSSSTTAARVIDFNSAATHNTIENCRILGNTNTGTGISRSVIYSVSDATADGNNQILNNVIQGGSYGIYWDGYTTAPYETGLVIQGNQISGVLVRPIAILNMNGFVISSNVIQHINTTALNVYGISVTNSFNGGLISANQILSRQHGLLLSGHTGSGTDKLKIINNVVSSLPSTNISTYGLHLVNSSQADVYHNSVNMVNALNTNYSVFDAGSQYITYRNNIFRNESAGQNTDFVIFTTGAGTGSTFNYNNYVWDADAVNIASIDGSVYTVSNSVSYYTNGAGGQNSIHLIPGFVSDTDLSPNSVLLNQGLDLTADVSVDYYGILRTLPVTLGAIEYKPGANDAGVVSLLPLQPCPGVNVIQARLRNYGTATLSSAQVHWTVNGIAQAAYNWTGNVASGATGAPISIGTFTFASGNTYSIQAWISLPNGNTDTDVRNDSLRVSRTTAMGGSYTIGTGGNYNSFSLAIADLVNLGICGSVNFEVLNGTYTEFFTLPEITGAGNQATITFQSFSGDSTLVILQSTNSPVVNLAGADYIRFRKMTIQNTNSSTSGARVIDLNSAASHNTIENCRLIGNSNAGTGPARSVIYSASDLTNDPDNKILNNVIQGGSYGIYWEGYNQSQGESGLIISGNQIFGAYVRPAFVQDVVNFQFRNNHLNHLTTANTSVYAFSLRDAGTGSIVAGNTILSKQHGMLLHNLQGITGQTIQVFNNMISSLPSATLITYGIHIDSSAYTDIQHNSVNTVNTSALSYGIYNQQSTSLTFRNNIIRTVGSNISGTYVLHATGAGTGNVYDYNDYVWHSTAADIASISGVVYSVSNSVNFFMVSAGGSNSIQVNPFFTSDTLLTTCETQLNQGTYIAGIPVDKSGLLRKVTATTIGASEVKNIFPAPQNVNISAWTCNSFTLNWQTVNQASGYEIQVATDSIFTQILPSYNPLQTGLVNSQSITGLNPGIKYFVRIRAIDSCIVGTYSSVVSVRTINLSDSINPVSNSPLCAGQNLSLSVQGNVAGAQYVWSGPNGFTSNTSTVLRNQALSSFGGIYTLSVSAPGCNAAMFTRVVSVNDSITEINTGGNTVLCAGQALLLTASSNSGNVSYHWTGPDGFTNDNDTAYIANTPETGAGTYTVLASSLGCNQMSDTLMVIVNQAPVFTVTTNAPVCAGDPLYINVTPSTTLPFSWSGPNSFSSTNLNTSMQQAKVSDSGVYTLTVDQPGCGVSSYYTSIIVGARIQNLSLLYNQPVCEPGELRLSATPITGASYLWTGPNGYTSDQAIHSRGASSLSMSGLYSLQVSSNGCPSEYRTLNVLVNPALAVTPGANTPICEGSVLYLTSAYQAGATYAWTGPAGFTSNMASPARSLTIPGHSGNYNLSVSVPGCGTVSATVSVTVGASAQNLSLTGNNVLCAGMNLNMSASSISGATYTWSGPAGFSSSLPNPGINNVSALNAGIYSLSVSSPGCPTANRTLTVNVTSLNAVPSSNSPVCQGGVIYLNANAAVGASYSWSGPNGFSSGLRAPSILNASQVSAGDYTLSMSAPGCNNVSAVSTVQVGQSLSSITQASNTPVCTGASLNISANNVTSANILWTGPDGFTSSSAIINRSNVQPVSGGVYTLVINSPGCGSTTRTLNTVVNAPIVLNAVNSGPVCQGSPLYLSVNSISRATYAWSGPNGFASALQNPSLSNTLVTQTGIYTLVVNTPSCGVASTTTSVAVNSNFNGLTVSSNSPLCTGGNLQFNTANRTGYVYNWTGPNGFTAGIENPVINAVTALHQGVYNLTITSQGCGSRTFQSSVIVNDSSLVNAVLTTPVCIGQVVYLNGAGPNGATYTWNGPAGFASALKSTSRSNAQLLHAGTYTLNANVPGCGMISRTATLVVNSCRLSENENSSSDSLDSDIQTHSPSGLQDEILEVFCWPSPGQGEYIHLNWSGLGSVEKEVKVRISDALGRVVHTEVFRYSLGGVAKHTFSFENKLSQGVYTIFTENEGRTAYTRFVIK